MSESVPPPDRQTARKSRTLVLIMLGIVIASIVAFLVLRPDPSGAGHPTTTTQH